MKKEIHQPTPRLSYEENAPAACKSTRRPVQMRLFCAIHDGGRRTGQLQKEKAENQGDVKQYHHEIENAYRAKSVSSNPIFRHSEPSKVAQHGGGPPLGQLDPRAPPVALHGVEALAVFGEKSRACAFLGLQESKHSSLSIAYDN